MPKDTLLTTEMYASDILMTDVAPVAIDILLKHIKKDIYEAYTPSFYERRYSLLARENIMYKMIDANTLFITSTAQPNGKRGFAPGGFLQMLEEGDLGWWRKGFPRPAITNAQNEVDSSSKIANAISRGRKRLNI